MSKTANTSIDAALIRELAEVLNASNLTEIEVEHENLRIRVAREVFSAQPQQVHYAPAPVAQPVASPVAVVAAAPVSDMRKHAGAVTSPMVGTAFRRPSPDAKPFVEVGSVVKEGEKLLLIEAMKTFNEINATKSGTVTQIFFDDGKAVEFGEALLIIE